MHATHPHLTFRRSWEISPRARYELGQCDATVRAIGEMPIRPEHHRRLLGVSLVKGARATTAIEGNTLSEEEVERVADGGSLLPSKEYQEIEVRNVLNAMNVLLQEVAVDAQDAIITPELILRLHQMIGKDLGEHFDAIPGRFRTDKRVVGAYRCPDPAEVRELVQRLCDWLRSEFRYSQGDQPFADAVVQAIVTHVYVEWIHPFGDGNGRTGRLLEFYILLRAGNPDIASHILSNFYNLTRPEYYRQLDLAGRTGDLSNFIEYAVEGFRDGLFETVGTIQASLFETAWRGFVHDRFAERAYTKKTVFKRRRALMLAFPTGEDVPVGRIAILNPEIARLYATLSERTLRRDLGVLSEMRLLAEVDGIYRANVGALRMQMPRRLERELRTPVTVERAREGEGDG